MGRLFGLTEKKQQFLQSRVGLSLLVCAVLICCAFVVCAFIQSAREKQAHSAVIGTRIAAEETQPVTESSPVPMVEITDPRPETEAETQPEEAPGGDAAETEPEADGGA